MKIVAAARLSRKSGGKSQGLSSSHQARFHPLGFGCLRFVWHLGFGIWNFFSNSVCCFSNQLPCLAQMLFRGEHITKANSHHRSAAQFCLRQISASGSIDSLHNFAVQLIELPFCCSRGRPVRRSLGEGG